MFQFYRSVVHNHKLIFTVSLFKYYKLNTLKLYNNFHEVYNHSNVISNDFCSNNAKNLTILQYGFSEENLDKLMKHKSVIEKINPQQLKLTFDTLLRCQFGEERLIQVVDKNPYILLVNSEIILSHFLYLSEVFKKVSVFRIFLNSPEVLNDSLDIVKRKVDYLTNKMGSSNVEIGKSGALGYSLPYIKERHIFLERAGIFKLVDEKHRKFITNNKNPSLDYILNTTEEEFSTKVAGLSLFEFETFQQMFAISDLDDSDDCDDNSEEDENMINFT